MLYLSDSGSGKGQFQLVIAIFAWGSGLKVIAESSESTVEEVPGVRQYCMAIEIDFMWPVLLAFL